MSESNNRNAFFSVFNFSEILNNYKKFPEAAKSIYMIQQNNIDTLNQISSVSMENFKEIAHRQTDIFSKIMSNTAVMANDLTKEGKPEDKLARNIKVIQESYEQAMENAKEVSEIVRRANAETSKILRESTAKNNQKMQGSIVSNKSESA